MMHGSPLYKSMLPTPLGDCFVCTMGEHLVGLGFAEPYADRLAEHLAHHTGRPVQEAQLPALEGAAVRGSSLADKLLGGFLPILTKSGRPAALKLVNQCLPLLCYTK